MKYGKNLTLQQIIDACLQSDEEKFCDWDLEQDSSDEEEYIEPCFRSSHLITEFEPVRFVIYFNIVKKKEIKNILFILFILLTSCQVIYLSFPISRYQALYMAFSFL